MQFKKIYIEITNSCNFACSFCFPSTRKKKYITVNEFREIVQKIKPFTNYIYLHVLGEPLLHPQLDEILTIAEEAGLSINITTNGALIKEKRSILLKHNIRQLNISIHDIEENLNPTDFDKYFDDVLSFAQEISPKTYVCLRFWNQQQDEISEFNTLCLKQIKEKLHLTTDISAIETKGNGIKLLDHVFLQNANRFEWPDLKNNPSIAQKSCYALKDHIAILSDGSVVPCCIDADASMHLGNIYEDNLQSILNSERAIRIKEGFSQKITIEKLCQTCGFVSSK
jgi:radical SAM protein with 4Fe4S-binding SPASM domain